MCGEKARTIRPAVVMSGSPPHVRGKAQQMIDAERETGITPACAGKRRIRVQRWLAGGDHPRMCGEKTKKIP